MVFTPAPRPVARLGSKAVGGILAEMPRRDIKTHLGYKLKGFETKKVKPEGGEFDADMINR